LREGGEEDETHERGEDMPAARYNSTSSLQEEGKKESVALQVNGREGGGHISIGRGKREFFDLTSLSPGEKEKGLIFFFFYI